MVEEENLAHDLYVAFGDKYGTTFSRITNAETRHLVRCESCSSDSPLPTRPQEKPREPSRPPAPRRGVAQVSAITV